MMFARLENRVRERTPPPELVYSSALYLPVDQVGWRPGWPRAPLRAQPLHWARQTLGYL